ncbi:MAG TPA: endonuclease/exonuclease/phosphatase family protein [Candidatus Limnocylindria bacterium]|nr:endonuclease/exonuclease/phosphatase family protein [Candidatus Limnocylindria bacterium]
MIGGAAFAVVGLLFVLAAIHTFTATLYQALFGKLPNTTLGAIAFLVFAASYLAIFTARRFGPRRAIGATGLVLATTTILSTLIRVELLDLVLSAVAIVAGTHWLVLLHASRTAARGSPVAVGLPVALAVDLVLRSLFATIPVVDAPVVLAVPLVVVAALLFLAGGIAALPAGITWSSPGPRGAIGLLAIGPLLLVAETGATNGAQIAAAAGLGLDGGPSTQIGTLLAGAGLAAGALVLARGLPARPIAALSVAIGAVGLWAHLPVVSLVAGAIFAAGILVAAGALLSGPTIEVPSPWLAVVAFGTGWVLFVGGAFAHYAYFADLRPLWSLAALVAVVALAVPPSTVPRLRGALTAAIVIGTVLVPAYGVISTPRPSTIDAPATFRIMTYNVHQGFDAVDVPSLDRIADTISRESPDVLVLEEVVRGWLIDDQHDVLGFLGSRLGMTYVFDPHIGDLYGNAILSRYPITDVRRISYAKEPGARYQPRGAILVRIGGVLIAATHLDENADATAVRQQQVRTLLDEIGKASPAIIACDCNAHPDAVELRLIDDSGFGDLAGQSGGGANTFPSPEPVERIDYLFGTGVTAAQGHVVASTASDHRAVVVLVTRSSR